MGARRALCFGGLTALLAGSACLPMPPTRTAATMRSLLPADAKFAITAPCAPAAAHAAVPVAGSAMSLEIEEASSAPGAPWIFRRGRRLADIPLLFRVDVAPVPGDDSSSQVRVFAAPMGGQFRDSVETITKPRALAMRIVAACAAGGGR